MVEEVFDEAPLEALYERLDEVLDEVLDVVESSNPIVVRT